MKPTRSRLFRLLKWLSLALGVVLLAVVGLIALGRSPGEAMTPAGLRRNQSLYVPVRDGTRLAVEIWLPADLAPGRRLPAIFRPARYVAAGESGPLERLQFALGREPGWLPGIDVFTEAGYALITVSLRGAGASFGIRDLELGDAEVDDLMDVLDWLVMQPWSDGRVALMGGSYDGATAEVLTGRGHPAVKAAVLQVSWLDAQLATHALARFRTYRLPQQLVICAWNHYLAADGDPFKPLDAPADPPPTEQWRMVVEFLDAHLKGGAPTRSEIRFTTLGSGGWTTVSNWPPPGFSPRRWYLGSERRLQLAPPQETLAVDRYEVDFDATTGDASRWNHFTPDIVYPDRAAADARLLTYTSEPLERDLEVTGSPVVHLEVVSSATDGAFHAYLEDVAPDGRVTYVTEGVLRALHRQQTTSELPYQPLGPKRTYRRGDNAPMVPGEVATLEFDLCATSVRFRQGHQLRLALAGADAGNFVRMPAEGAVSWEVQRGRDLASWVELPARTSQPLADRQDP